MTQTQTQAPKTNAPVAVKPAVSQSLTNNRLLRRQCACGDTPGPSGECEECSKKRQGLIRRSAITTQPPAAVPAVVQEVLRSPGQSLDPATRASLEPGFGHDFSQVRIHTDERAARSAAAIGARAYTLGQDIVFASHQYSPATGSGLRLLAHELTHVVQQGDTVAHGLQPAGLGPVDDACEAEAARVSGQVVAGGPTTVGGQAAPRLQRAPGWDSKVIEVTLEPIDPLTPGQESYTENGFLSQRMSSKLPVYRVPFCQSGSLPFNCSVEFRVDYSDEPRPQPFTPPQASVDFEFTATKGGAPKQIFKKSYSDGAAGYAGQDRPLKTNFGTKFNMTLSDNGDFRMVFKLADPDTGITRLYDDTIKVEASRPCM